MAKTLNIPAGTFANLSTLTVDGLGLLAGECQRRAAAAEGGSRSWTLWANRFQAVMAEADKRGWPLKLNVATGDWYPCPR